MERPDDAHRLQNRDLAHTERHRQVEDELHDFHKEKYDNRIARDDIEQYHH
ncbi:hypothetical protein [Hoeflea sp.]|uniref:hypothetical protein n=1 Tax=Hoeflea sp. TaxID=1940281 RepID=UPI003F4A879C